MKTQLKMRSQPKIFLESNAHFIFPEVNKGKYVVERRGGTKYKEDNVVITDDGITIKISDKEKRKGLRWVFLDLHQYISCYQRNV